jgi:hypothetical protein
VSSIDSPTSTPRSRPRRRLAAWLAFGAIGLATGAVWATGFASFTGANGTTAVSPAVTKSDAVAEPSLLANTVTADAVPLAYNWVGRWGSIAADKLMFTVDLSTLPAGNDYNVAVLLTNTSLLTGWASMQLELERVDIAASGTCDPTDFNGATNAQLLNFDDEDAGVYWNTLPGNAVYCIGLAASPGDDIAGTFLRSAQDANPTAFPTFVTTVDRAA